MLSVKWASRLLWTSLTALLAASAAMSFNACGLTFYGQTLSFCTPAPAENLAALAAEARALELQLALVQCPAGQSPIGRFLPSTPSGSGNRSGSGAGSGAAPGDGTAPSDNGPASTTPDSANGTAQGQPTAQASGGATQSTQTSNQASPIANGTTPQSGQSGPGDRTQVAIAPQDCPAGTENPETASIIMVVDRSKSMGLPAGIDEKHIAELDERIATGDARTVREAQQEYNELVALPGRTRLDELKDSLIQATHIRLPQALFSFADCRSGVRNHGTFAAENRQAFLQSVMSMTTSPGTPLADALRAAIEQARELGDANTRIVLVSDGIDTCGGDPCAAAAGSGGIPIDVIAIGYQPPLTCIANLSGGRMLSDVEDATLGQLISNAINSDAVPPGC